MGNDGRSQPYYAPHRKTNVELTKEQVEIALTNLTAAAHQLTKASKLHKEAKAAEHKACTCCPQHGGK